LLAAIEDEATRNHRSTASCIAEAWEIARNELATLAAPTPLLQECEDDDDTAALFANLRYEHARAEAIYSAHFAEGGRLERAQLAIPAEVERAMRDEANRLGRPLGWVVARTWCLGWVEPILGTEDTAPIARVD
jgi:hypothetical protein